MLNGMNLGGWELVNMEPCNLPQKVATGFAMVTEGLIGAKYIPVLYAGTQLVKGLNHLLICKQTLAVEGAAEHLVAMVLNQDCTGGDLVGKWSVVSIEQII